MKVSLCTALRVVVPAIALVVAGCGGDGDSSSSGSPSPSTVVPPLPLPGPYTVACSNVAQDFSRVAAGEEAEAYWEGSPSSAGAPQYVTDLLADPANTLSVTVTAPNDPTLYGSFAGRQVGFVLLACYPTVANNPRADYPLPTGRVVPHMQTGSDPPLFADAGARYPVLAFSHGLRGSPISSDYIEAISVFASYGYIVVAPFHGDPRFSGLKIDDLSDAVKLLANLADFVALQALRPRAVSSCLDLMLAHPQWRDHINATQIGGFGASMGGETMLLLAGAGIDFVAGAGVESGHRRSTESKRRLATSLTLARCFCRHSDATSMDSITLPFHTSPSAERPTRLLRSSLRGKAWRDWLACANSLH